MPHKILMTLMGMEIGGAETHVLELSKTLQRMGLDVHVVSNGGIYVHELEACGIKHYRVPLHNKQFANMFSSYNALRKIIVDNDIRLVHAHARIPAFICGLLQKRLKFRLVTTAHGQFSVAFPFNRLSNWGDRVLAVSQDIKNYLLANYNVDYDSIRLTVNGIDTSRFSPEADATELIAELGLRPDTKKIVSVSRLDNRPDHQASLPAHALIAIAERIAAQTPIEIIIVGDGDDFDKVQEEADAVNKRFPQKVIHLTGRRTDVHRFMALADVFVNISRAAMEAMSAGVPVILAGSPGYLGIFDETTRDAAIETNFTCRGYGDVTVLKLEKDLRTLLSCSSGELEELGRLGRELIRREYSLERMAKDAIAVYDDVLSPKFGQPGVDSVNVVISGYYGYNNSGDDIMLKSIVDNLRARGRNLNLTVLSRKPKETRAQFYVGAVQRFNLVKVFLLLRKAELHIMGGGNLIQDETSTQSLIYYLWVINTARRLGKKNMLYAKGIGPVNRPGNILRVQKALNRVDMITLRESGSLEVLKEMGITAPEIHVTADAAFALPPIDTNDSVLKTLGIKKPFFCVALRSWKHNPPGLESQVAHFADFLTETYGYQAVFVPMRPEEDNEISHRVMALMCRPAVFVEPAPGDYNQARNILGLADFAVCMRLHALIYAMEKGVPAIGLVYSPKIRQFMETMGQQWHMPVEDTDFDTLVKFATAIHDDKKTISAEIYESACRLRELAERNAELCVELIER
ncbi:MAG: polysaccharide pyruvyl transferase CsaB [Defluviitaleaceae bacterium]|nr:polysaccharide pyruvyl transferase CsaB [Defluviitaleaceae bacterium]